MSLWSELKISSTRPASLVLVVGMALVEIGYMSNCVGKHCQTVAIIIAFFKFIKSYLNRLSLISKKPYHPVVIAFLFIYIGI